MWKATDSEGPARYVKVDAEPYLRRRNAAEANGLVNCLGTIPWAAAHNDPAFGRWALDTITELSERW